MEAACGHIEITGAFTLHPSNFWVCLAAVARAASVSVWFSTDKWSCRHLIIPQECPPLSETRRNSPQPIQPQTYQYMSKTDALNVSNDRVLVLPNEPLSFLIIPTSQPGKPSAKLRTSSVFFFVKYVKNHFLAALEGTRHIYHSAFQVALFRDLHLCFSLRLFRPQKQP